MRGEPHKVGQQNLAQKAVEQQLESPAHSSEKSMPGVLPQWPWVVSSAAPCWGSEGLSPGDFLAFRPSVLPQLPSSSAHSLDFTGNSRHRNAFDGTASSAVLESGPGVPWLCSGCLELILISNWDALMPEFPWASMS